MMNMNYDPEAIYQDADLEMMELEEAASRPFPTCEYKNCGQDMWRDGVCERHFNQEQREMKEARR